MAKKTNQTLRKAISPVLPVGSRRREFVRRIVRGQLQPRKGLSYKSWIEDKEPHLLSKTVSNGPIISIVVPCYNTPRKYIQPLVESVISQTYPNWQLVLVDSSQQQNNSPVETVAKQDKRIVYLKLDKNLGISGNTNKGIQNTTGDYVAFLDHDDVLPEWAINEIAAAIKANPKADIFYSDEDRLSEDGRIRMTPLFKPNWSPDLFLCTNYVAHFLVIKRPLLNQLKGLRTEYDGSQDYDLVLRALDHNPEVKHIPKILYHMRMAEGSTAKLISLKGYAHTSGNKALKDYFRRNHMNVKVLENADRPTNHRIQYQLKGNPLVSIIIPFKDNVDLLKKCLLSIKSKTKYKNYEIILISNNSQEKKTLNYLRSIKEDKRIRTFHYDKSFNYSAINNYGRSQANGKVLVFLNNDTEVLNGEWLSELASVAIQKDRGAVGALLYYPNRTIQHAGVVIGMDGAAGHVFRKLRLGTLTPFWLPDWPRNYLAVTGACVAVEADKFDQIGGFDERIVMAGSDVVFCLELFKKGYLNVYWPYAQLVHHESQSVKSYKNAPPSDYDISIEHYKPYLGHKDPYYNPNLELMYEWPTLRSNYGKD